MLWNMPRANRYIVSGQIYHLTHRCHDRSFLFRFAKDRNVYRAMLRDRLGQYPISCLGYCITSNHTHLLVKVDGVAQNVLGRFMQALEGEFAQYYNRRKQRSGAFWSDRYHAVMIDSGEYVWRCLRYIDLNMVRAGAVRAPSEWAWCGYQEMAGLRKRFRLIDQDAVLSALAPGRTWSQVVTHYLEAVRAALESERLAREACWTESLAVGSERFAQTIGSRIPNRMKVESVQEHGVWLVREIPSPYGSIPAAKNGPKVPKEDLLHA